MNYHDNITLLAIISDKTQTQSLRSVSHSHLHCCTDHYQLHSLTLVLSLLSVRVPKIHSSQSLISRCSSCRSRRWSTLYWLTQPPQRLVAIISCLEPKFSRPPAWTWFTEWPTDRHLRRERTLTRNNYNLVVNYATGHTRQIVCWGDWAEEPPTIANAISGFSYLARSPPPPLPMSNGSVLISIMKSKLNGVINYPKLSDPHLRDREPPKNNRSSNKKRKFFIQNTSDPKRKPTLIAVLSSSPGTNKLILTEKREQLNYWDSGSAADDVTRDASRG